MYLISLNTLKFSFNNIPSVLKNEYRAPYHNHYQYLLPNLGQIPWHLLGTVQSKTSDIWQTWVITHLANNSKYGSERKDLSTKEISVIKEKEPDKHEIMKKAWLKSDL